MSSFLDHMFDFESVYDQAVEQAPSNRESVFVEIGCWAGRSTFHMADRIRASGKPIHFFAVDTWLGAASCQAQLDFVKSLGGSLFSLFQENIRPLAEYVIPLRMSSIDAALHFRQETLDFVFIDADHTFTSVRNDIRAWCPKVKRGGVLAGHDIQMPSVRAAIEDTIPASEVEEIPSTRCTSWRWTKGTAPKGQWLIPLPAPFNEEIHPSHLLFIPYTANPDLFEQAAHALNFDGIRAFVIDDSIEGLDVSLVPTGWGVFKPRSRLTFTQVQNIAQRIAFDAGVKYLLFAHSDSHCVDNRVVPDLLALAETKPDWAVVFTHYDVLCAFRTEAIREIGPWDETFQWYSSDCDYYRRVRLAGWKAEGTEFGPRVNHVGSATLRHPVFSQEVTVQMNYQRGHYRHKWGGGDGEEKYTIPYGY